MGEASHSRSSLSSVLRRLFIFSFQSLSRSRSQRDAGSVTELLWKLKEEERLRELVANIVQSFVGNHFLRESDDADDDAHHVKN